jgi:hypothetical protein
MLRPPYAGQLWTVFGADARQYEVIKVLVPDSIAVSFPGCKYKRLASMYTTPFWKHHSWHVILQLHVVLTTWAPTNNLYPRNVPESGSNPSFPLR